MKNKLVGGTLVVLFVICTTLAIIINNLLIGKAGLFFGWWASTIISMLIWSLGYSFLEKTFNNEKY